MNKPKVSDATKRQLFEMFLPELHQAWWAETLAQLRDEERFASDAPSLEAVDARIRDHYRHQHAIELTRTRLLDQLSRDEQQSVS